MCGILLSVAARPPSPTTRNRSIEHLCPKCFEYASFSWSRGIGSPKTSMTEWMLKRKSSIDAGGRVGPPARLGMPGPFLATAASAGAWEAGGGAGALAAVTAADFAAVDGPVGGADLAAVASALAGGAPGSFAGAAPLAFSAAFFAALKAFRALLSAAGSAGPSLKSASAWISRSSFSVSPPGLVSAAVTPPGIMLKTLCQSQPSRQYVARPRASSTGAPGTRKCVSWHSSSSACPGVRLRDARGSLMWSYIF
mmetsp:Transcript_5380/g.15860  ORF Transcript_5380/g.15860 Transcript_5380/m.15860 type:complete len:253 (+) Transcript_5380:1102-1860(+)